jgi:radical SAM protein with 4Fe4S-binding SPASM domain
MKLKSDIYLLKGSQRWALYDFTRELVVPVTEAHLKVLRTLATGKNWLHSRYRTTTYATAFQELRRQGFLVGGRPQVCDLEFPSMEKIPLPSKFSHVWLELTNACNLSCQHCYSESSPRVNRMDELDVKQWQQIIDKLLAHGVQQFTFIGGEPLLRPKLIQQLADYTHQQAPSTQLRIFSNLSFSSSKTITTDYLKEYKIHIGTSLYGMDAATHDSMTKLKGSWEKTTRFIRRLVQSGIPVFAGYYHNEKAPIDKVAVKAWIENLGIKDYRIEVPSPVGRATEKSWTEVSTENHLPTIKYFSYASPAENQHYHNCFKDVLTVKHNGVVIPCIMQRNFPLVDLKEHSMNDLFANSMFREFAGLNKDKIEGCKDCEFRYGCFDCRPDAMGTSNNLYAKPNCGYEPNAAL